MRFCPECRSRLRPINRYMLACVRCGYRETREKAGKPRSELVDFFPHATMRKFQRSTIEQIGEALKSTKFVILEAPVGFGKSAVAATICKYLGSAHILTATKQLQDQYASEFSFPLVKGKPNFRCKIPSSSGKFLPCSKGRCEVDWSLRECPYYLTFEEYRTHKRRLCTKNSKCERVKNKTFCRYYEQKWEGFAAPITVYNYPFIFSELKYTRDVPHRKLLVCDEVHDLEKQIVNFASFCLRKAILKYFCDEIRLSEVLVIPKNGLEDPTTWLSIFSSLKEMLNEFISLNTAEDIDQELIATCGDMLKDLNKFTENLKTYPSNWVVNNLEKDPSGSVDKVIFQPIVVADYTLPLFNLADNILLMSATVSSKERLCKVLGIEEGEAFFIPINESTFPSENRPIYALNVARLNRASMDVALFQISRAVNEIMNKHAKERGVIHTTSYLQARRIIQNISESNRRRLVTTEGSFDRSVLMQIHGENDASVLISPSLYQGVDLKDESSRFQVIVKVPYPDLSNRRIRVKLERDREWYDWQTALRLVQTYGRSVRSEEDHAVTYVLDSNFSNFVNMHRNLFPKFFLESLKEKSNP